MADYEQKNGQGSIFKNEKKEKDTQPDYIGKITTPTGEKWDVSLWLKKPEGKKPYFSVAIKEPYVKPESQQTGFPDEPDIEELPF